MKLLLLLLLTSLFLSPNLCFCGGEDDEKLKEILKLATPSSKPIRWYRWGQGRYENALAQDNKEGGSAFNIDTINPTPRTAAGKGLYVSEGLTDSSEFAHKTDKGLVSVVARPGSLVLDITSTEILDKLKKAGISKNDIFRLNPPVMLKFGTQPDWWVIKDPTHVKVEPFSGDEFEPDELLRELANIRDPETRAFFRSKIAPALSKRPLPLPQHPAFEHMAHAPSPCLDDSKSIMKPISSLIQGTYLWKYDGNCALFSKTTGSLTIVEDNVDRSQCKAISPTEVVRNTEGNCAEVVASNPQVIVSSAAENLCPSPYYCTNILNTNFASLDGGETKGRPGERYVLKSKATPNSYLFRDQFRTLNRQSCEDLQKLASKYSLLCTPTEEKGKYAIASTQGLRSSSLDTFNSFQDCVERVQTAHSELRAICLRGENKFHIYYYDTAFDYHSIEEGIDNLPSCLERLTHVTQTQVASAIKVGSAPSKNPIRGVDVNRSIASVRESSPYLSHLFDSSAQVAERLTVGEHTEKVLKQFENQSKYYDFESLTQKYPQFGNLKELLQATLVLHDIGKSLGPSVHQHEFTIPILSHYLIRWGYTPAQIQLAVELVNHDLFGKMIQTKKADAILEDLNEKAVKLHTSLRDFAELQKLIYISDASSYDAVRKTAFVEDNGKLVPKSPTFVSLGIKCLLKESKVK